MQRSRKKNIDLVRKYIGDKEHKKIDRAELARLVQINVGCTENKAFEYIKLVLGEEK